MKHLPKLESNHIPLLIDFNLVNLIENNTKPFRFLAPWLLHEDFKNLINSSWDESGNLIQNIESFIEKAKVWNKDVFETFGRERIIFC